MKIVFMGTPQFAVPTLQALIDNHEVLAVITQPDKPKGRGNNLQCPPVKELAMEHGLTVLQPPKIKDPLFINDLANYKADVFVVVAYGQILPETVLNMPTYGCLNVHGSLLPKYRGAAPIQWSVINGEVVTGVTIMYMDKGLDTGDMILKKQLIIEQTDTSASLYDKMSIIGANALLEALTLMEKGKVIGEKQDDSLSTYAPMIHKQTGLISWNTSSAKSIINLIRGLNPWPSAYTYYNDELVKIWSAESYTEKPTPSLTATPGTILEIIKNKGVVVQSIEGFVLIKEIQVFGKKRMNISDYLCGHTMEIGSSFSSSSPAETIK